jgi:hypothetical protein
LKQLHELYGEQDLVALIEKGSLKWLGYMEMMENNRVPKRMLCGRPGGRGRPLLRWLEDVKKNFRGVGVKRWRTKAVDRNEWQRILEEV